MSKLDEQRLKKNADARIKTQQTKKFERTIKSDQNIECTVYFHLRLKLCTHLRGFVVAEDCNF